MATPDHKTRARSSLARDDNLSVIPDTSHRATPTKRPHSDAPSASMTRLAGTHRARRQRDVPLHAVASTACRDGRNPMDPSLYRWRERL